MSVTEQAIGEQGIGEQGISEQANLGASDQVVTEKKNTVINE